MLRDPNPRQLPAQVLIIAGHGQHNAGGVTRVCDDDAEKVISENCKRRVDDLVGKRGRRRPGGGSDVACNQRETAGSYTQLKTSPATESPWRPPDPCETVQVPSAASKLVVASVIL